MLDPIIRLLDFGAAEHESKVRILKFDEKFVYHYGGITVLFKMLIKKKNDF